MIDPTTGRSTRIMFSGDVFRNSGWINTESGDKYLYPSIGPFQLAAGDSQEVIAAQIIGHDTDALSSLAVVFDYVFHAKQAYQSGFEWERGDPPAPPIPEDYRLETPYPNPFNSQVTIEYDLPRQTFVSLDIFDNRGRLVRSLVSEEQAAGFYSVVWDGVTNFSTLAANGVYIIRLRVPGVDGIRKVVLLK